jgi:hypothetical protein
MLRQNKPQGHQNIRMQKIQSHSAMGTTALTVAAVPPALACTLNAALLHATAVPRVSATVNSRKFALKHLVLRQLPSFLIPPLLKTLLHSTI